MPKPPPNNSGLNEVEDTKNKTLVDSKSVMHAESEIAKKNLLEQDSRLH